MTRSNDANVEGGEQAASNHRMTEEELVGSLSELLDRYHREGETNVDGLYPLRYGDESTPDLDVYVVRMPSEAVDE